MPAKTMLARLQVAQQRCLAIVASPFTTDHAKGILRKQLKQLAKFEEIISLVPSMADSGPCRRLMQDIDDLLDHLECAALKHSVH